MKKEKELAERRKNDPALNHTQDHLVRKLFSKFKRGPAMVGGGAPGDIERGDSFIGLADNGIPIGAGAGNGTFDGGLRQEQSNGNSNGRSGFGGRDNRVEPAEDDNKKVIQHKERGVKRGFAGGGGAWARFKSGGGGSKDSQEPTPVETSQDETGASRRSSDATPNKTAAVSTISVSSAAPVHKDVTPADLATAVAVSSSVKQQVVVSPTKTTPSKSPSKGDTSQEYREIMRNMADFKVDMRRDINAMNDKINKMESMMTDFIGKLNTALPQAVSEDGGNGSGSDRHRHRHHHHRRRHDKSRSRDRRKCSGTEDEAGDGGNESPGKKSSSEMKFVPGRKEEYL